MLALFILALPISIYLGQQHWKELQAIQQTPIKVSEHAASFGETAVSHASVLGAEKVVKDEEMVKAVEILQTIGVIQDPAYWLQQAQSGKTVPGEYAAALLKRMAAAQK